MVYIVENNGVYGLTKGQFSATADKGSKAKRGAVNCDEPIDMVMLALQMGATFVARAFSGDKEQLVPLIEAAVLHKGAAFIDVVSPCVAFNNHPGSTKSYDYVRAHNEAVNRLDFMREDARRMRVAEVDAMLTEWEAARAMARRIGDELIPLVTQRLDAALAAYRGGTGALSPVLEARRSELDARLALLQQEQAAAKAWAWLQFVRPMKEGT